MKQLLLSLAVMSVSFITAAQTHVSQQKNLYEAANWQLWLLDNPQAISVAPPPAPGQAAAELKMVKQRLSQLDQKKLSEIYYWNAGAPAYRWNQILPELFKNKFEVALRMPSAWMNVAIYDATILAWKEKMKYKRNRPHQLDPSLKTAIAAPPTYSYPCEHTVTAAAAAHVLAYFFPEKKDSILQLAHAASQSRIDAGVQYPSDAAAGWALGEQVAQQIIEKAKNEASTAAWKGTLNKDPKKWTGNYPPGVTLTTYKPFVLRSADQFRPPAPPDFENDMKELKSFKQTFKSAAQAYFWANSGNVWGDLAGQKMFEYRIADDAPTVARIYTVLNVAYRDVAIAIMDAKYTYWGIRPNQYDTTYKPLISTPPFPGYPSGHAAGAAVASAVLEYFFPADAKQFQQMAKECADSRFYAGIHFRTDNETGLVMGRNIGQYVVDNWMKTSTGLISSKR